MMDAKITEVALPAGTYWVGDPCYAIPEGRWDEWLEAADFQHQDVLIADVDGHQAVGVGTAYGDGQYLGDDGTWYPVDAGLLGATPAALVEGNPRGLRKVTFPQVFSCYSDEGRIAIGHITIDTSEEDWDE